jgi:hypothetical protein
MNMKIISGVFLAAALTLPAQDVATATKKAAKATEKGAKVVGKETQKTLLMAR